MIKFQKTFNRGEFPQLNKENIQKNLHLTTYLMVKNQMLYPEDLK